MAIYFRCKSCRAWLKAGSKKCHRCGEPAPRERHYYVVLTLKNGKQIWEAAGTSYKAAKIKELQLKQQLALGEVTRVKDDKIRFSKFWEEHYFPWVTANNDPSWVRRKAKIYELHLKPFFGKMRLKDITRELVERYVQKRLTQKVKNRDRLVSPAEVNREIAVLKHALSKAVEWGFLKENPLKGFKMLKEDKKTKEPHPLTLEEAEKLIQNLSPEVARIVTFALLTGLRLKNVLNARWDWIDWERKLIVIPASEMKASKDHVIPMTEALHAFLKTLPRLPDCPYLFPKPDGTPRKDIRQAFRNALKRAGLPKDITFHDLRHTFAVWALSQGVHIGALKTLMGHSTITTTQKYLKLHDEFLRKEAEKLNKLGENIVTAPLKKLLEQDE